MRREPIVTWVVYERQMPGKPKMTVMCEQSDWDGLVLTQSNDCTLVRAGMTNEGEAEQLARSGAIPVKEKVARPKAPAATGAPSATHSPQQTAMHNFWQRAKLAAAAEKPRPASCQAGRV